MTERFIDCSTSRSPSWHTIEEAVAWSAGAEYGVRETLAAVQLYLKEIGQPATAMAIAQRVRIKE